MPLAISSRAEGSATVVATEGDIDIHSAPDLRETLTDLIKAGSSEIVVDLQGTAFLDSSALGALIGASKEAQAADGTLKVVCTRGNVLKVFEITRVSQIIAIFDSVAAALDAR